MVDQTAKEPLRDQIGRVLYEEAETETIFRPLRVDWYKLNEYRREPWRRDGDRVLEVMHTHLLASKTEIEEAADAIGGVDWLATAPHEFICDLADVLFGPRTT